MTPDELRHKIDGFTDRDLLIEVYTMMENMQEHVSHLHQQVHGNGQPGLKDRVSKLEERTTPTVKVAGISGLIGAFAVAFADQIFKKFS